MYELHVEAEFAAAHFLREYEGKCENLHGHNWKIDVHFEGAQLDRAGMLMDFKEARAIISEVIEGLDHRFLNDLPAFREVNPTTENISRILYHQIGERLPEGIRVARVTCWESERAGASYREP